MSWNGPRVITASECDALWYPWTPAEVARRLAPVTAPWYIAAGWALDLFTGHQQRAHQDIEIGVPHDLFVDVIAALPGFEWDVAGDDQLWRYPEQSGHAHQTWLRDPITGEYHLDVFREPRSRANLSGSHQWVCRRDPSLTLDYDELILRTEDNIPFVIPEVALLFKAKNIRPKDDVDFQHTVPAMSAARKSRLQTWLARLYPGHRWISALG